MNKKYNILNDPFFYLFIFFSVFPFIPLLGKYLSLGTEMLIWILYAISFNLLLGYTGLASFGHGAFYGAGSYVTALLYLQFVNNSKNIFLPLLAAILVVGILAYFLGFVIRKKRGIYFALITVAFSQVLYIIAFKWTEVTGGELGITRLFRGQFLGIDLNNPTRYYYFVLIIVFLGSIVIRKITLSPFGKTLQSLKQNEIRIQYLGYNSAKYVCYAMTIAGIFAGLSGGLYCLLYSSVFADNMSWVKSGDVVIASVLGGGLTNFYGPIVGSTIFVIAREILSSIWDNWMLLYGLSFVVIILFMPTGLLGILERMKEKKHVEQFSNNNNKNKRDLEAIAHKEEDK
ncbi:MAG: branched-chain amino acid ABC transporter permease [Actinobacteria bacterium]|nr:branched-chain amino acid ABC transporter permease [Actinomycetota bacterium]MBE3138639.1 branched-chain amino acid ABC transporter permease [Actinomycetota bacterium]